MIKIDEIDKFLKKLKVDKASGLDGVASNICFKTIPEHECFLSTNQLRNNHTTVFN